MIITVLAAIAFLFAAIPAYVFFRNVTVFQRLPQTSQTNSKHVGKLPAVLPTVSVLIPARNEERAIGPCIQSILACADACEELAVEVVVLDDHSEDETAARVQEIATSDVRVRLQSANPLPAGWCGKQHACSELAKLAANELLIFIDADVRLSENALARIATEYQRSGVALLSGFPRQRTGTLAERMLIPLIHFVLLGFLSLRRMRSSTHPAFGAGCGQLFITSKDAYDCSGGHAKIRKSLHDGLKLPRLYRTSGLKTDLFDATDIASCRMYRNAWEVWGGLKKNATEGVANAKLILPVTLLLFLGQVLPFVLVAIAATVGEESPITWTLIASGCLAAMLPRLVSAVRFRQSLLGALLHPVSIVFFLLIQWSAFVGSFSNQKVSWKGRPYPA